MAVHNARWLLVGLVCLALWPAHAPAQGDQWESYIAAGAAAYQQGSYADAEERLEPALKEAETFGSEDPRLAKSLNNLANLYRTQGKYAEAEPLRERSLEIVKKALGSEHPLVAKSLENYAALPRETGRITEASEMEARATAIHAKHSKENQ